MRDRRVLLAKIFSYGMMIFQLAFFLASFPRFVSCADWGGSLLMLGSLIGTTILIFVYPNIVKVISSVPYRWGVASVLALSILFVGVAMGRLPIILQGLAAEPSDYVAVFGSVLFAAVNVVAILLTAKGGEVGKGMKHSNPEA